MKKNRGFWEIVLLPIVIALVGVIGTYLITNQQIKSSRLLSQTQLESAEKLNRSSQQIKIIEIFSEKITSNDIREREIAIRILSALDLDPANKLIRAIAQTESEDTIVRSIARSIIRQEQAQESCFPVVGSYISLTEAFSFVKKLESKKIPYQIEIYDGTNGYYAVCLGGKLTEQEAQLRVEYAKTKGIANDAYLYKTNEWLVNLYK